MDDELMATVEAALEGDWHRAHGLVQDRADQLACWLHAMLHKIEGDAWNSCYWYARCSANYDDFADSQKELERIRVDLCVTPSFTGRGGKPTSPD